MNWRIKGAVQKVLSHVPQGVRMNDLLQRTVGGLRHFDREIAYKVEDWLLTLSYMADVGVQPQGLRYMEIGTGWFPTFPLCFALAGAQQCHTFDLTRHLSEPLTFRMLRGIKPHLPALADAIGVDPADLELTRAGWAVCDDVDNILRQANVRYCAPANATATKLPAGSIDVVYSNSVLEHVPRNVIRDMMVESVRVLRSGGLMIHSVNCGDHYAYFDRNITAVNYLTYTEEQWRPWNNRLLYQNRMRPQDFLDLAVECGFEIALNLHRAKPELLSALPSLKIAPQFQHYPPEQLCCTSISFVGRKP